MADNEGGAAIFEPNFNKIVENIRGAEGPVFDKNGNFYMVAPEVEKDNKFAGQFLKVDISNKQTEIICEPSIEGEGGIPAGCQCDRDNNIWIADMRLGILKVNTKGSFTQICKKDKDGNVMQGCNDCIFDFDGNLWVTAPAGDIAPAAYSRSSKESPFGSVYCLPAGEQEVVKIDTGFAFSNGIAVKHSADGKPVLLIVAETPTKSLWGYNIDGPGKVSGKKLWGKLPGSLEGGPDGMDFDEDDNLLVAHWGSGHLEVFGPEGGSPHTRIKCPFKNPSNVHFQKDSSTVLVTEHEFHGLWKFEWKHKGKLQFCDKI